MTDKKRGPADGSMSPPADPAAPSQTTSDMTSALAAFRRLLEAGPMPMHPEPDEDDRGPAVESYTAEQDLGPYPITITGSEGAYWVDALERDPEGPFVSLQQARDFVEFMYGEFITVRPQGT